MIFDVVEGELKRAKNTCMFPIDKFLESIVSVILEFVSNTENGVPCSYLFYWINQKVGMYSRKVRRKMSCIAAQE